LVCWSGEGGAEAGDHRFWRLEDLPPGEVDRGVAGLAELVVALSLVEQVVAVVVLDEPVSLGDHPLGAPEEIDSGGELRLLAVDGDLQLGRVQARLGEDDPSGRLERRLGPLVGEFEGAPGLPDARPAGRELLQDQL